MRWKILKQWICPSADRCIEIDACSNDFCFVRTYFFLFFFPTTNAHCLDRVKAWHRLKWIFTVRFWFVSGATAIKWNFDRLFLLIRLFPLAYHYRSNKYLRPYQNFTVVGRKIYILHWLYALRRELRVEFQIVYTDCCEFKGSLTL